MLMINNEAVNDLHSYLVTKVDLKRRCCVKILGRISLVRGERFNYLRYRLGKNYRDYTHLTNALKIVEEYKKKEELIDNCISELHDLVFWVVFSYLMSGVLLRYSDHL